MNNVSDLIKIHEGLRLKPYRCTADKLTIGYGRNLEDRGISEAEAEMLLRNDIIEVTGQLCMEPYWSQLNIVRQAVLIDMCFNLGYSGLKKFKRFLAALEEGDFRTAAEEMMDSRWAEQVGTRATRLCNLMLTGEWE